MKKLENVKMSEDILPYHLEQPLCTYEHCLRTNTEATYSG